MTMELINILIIDDCAEDRETYRRLLKQNPDYNFNVMECENGEDGLERCQQEKIDCLVLDYMLPDIDGIEFLQELKKFSFQGVVLMLTGEGNEKVAVQALKEGAHDYLVKGKDLFTSFHRTIQSAVRMNDSNLKRKRAEEKLKYYAKELERSNKELEHFAALACHDLQEPLRKFMAFGERLSREYEPVLDEQGKSYLERMDKAAKRMKNFINDLLQYSKVTTRENSYQAIDMNKMMVEILEILEFQVSRVQGKVVVDNLPHLEVDPMPIRQLFINLLGNALKFHKENVSPVVKVSAQKDGEGYWVMQIEDNGIGFDEKYSERILKPFERLHGMNVYEGTGMGLAICKKIIDHHNGSIEITSQPGEGTCVKIRLPEKRSKEEMVQVSPMII
jgi:signal transduction histidine kinase